MAAREKRRVHGGFHVKEVRKKRLRTIGKVITKGMSKAT